MVARSTDLLGFSPFTIYVIPTHIWDLAICPDFLVDFGTDIDPSVLLSVIHSDFLVQ